MWSIRTEIRLAILTFLVVQVMTSFGAIALLTRVTGSMDRVVAHNVAAIESVEDLSATLAAVPSTGATPEQRRVFRKGLQVAGAHFIGGQRPKALSSATLLQDVALAGEPTAVTAMHQALTDLTDAHRTAMVAEEDDAGRLGRAGAWAAVLLAMFGFALSVVVIRRLTRQLVDPLHELNATVVAFRSGDHFRRCRTSDAPVEFHAAAETFNNLLDATLVDRAREHRGQDIDRLALLHLLDDLPKSVLVIDAEGRITAANSVGMQALAVDAEGRLRQQARLHAKGGGPDVFGPGATVTPLGHDGWLVELDPPAAPEA